MKRLKLNHVLGIILLLLFITAAVKPKRFWQPVVFEQYSTGPSFDSLSTRIDSLPGPYYDVTVYGAIADGQASSAATNRIAVQAAVDDCESDGGGIVYFPPANKRYHIDSTIRIKEDGVWIKGFANEVAQIWFENQNDYRIGFEFLGDEEILNSGIEDLYIWLEEDTIVGVKFIHTRNCGIKDSRIRNTSGTADSTIAVSFRGQSVANWSGLNYIMTSKIHDVLIGIDIDSVSNNNRIVFNDISGNVARHPGSTGVRIRPTSGALGQCDTQVLTGNDIEGMETGVKTEAMLGKFTDNRFENVDTCWNISGVNNGNSIVGSSYASVSVEEYTPYGEYAYYGLKLDAGRSLKIGNIGSSPGSLNLYAGSSVGAGLKMYNSSATSLSIFEIRSYANSSHTNLFGETNSITEALIAPNYELKIGTVLNTDLWFYTYSTARLGIPRFGIDEYANNAAAIADGVEPGQMYYTVDGTEHILKVAH